ncbi:MAG: SCP2 sterol-binding domain-containing protein [Deltaproteobacteria bacterium]|nr:SCP2 sterol-binding domain-containing protein [Deltaproteobacteria bacterium]
MHAVQIEDPARMNLLGLMLAQLIDRNLTARRWRTHGPLTRVVVRGGRMAVTLVFGQGSFTIRRGAVDAPDAELTASLETLVDLALRGGILGALASGRLKVEGNTLALLRLRPLLRTRGAPNSFGVLERAELE